MANIPLSFGSAFLAFSPFLSLFFLIVYKKAQLVIVSTTAAFFFLLAATGASITWYIFDAIGLDGPFTAIIPGVFFQFMARCAFVSLYHKVEYVIQQSLKKQREEENKNNDGSQDEPGTEESVAGSSQRGSRNRTDAARLHLELNDAISAIAAATGYGGMHAILLYGTLLASQVSNVGVLFQESCPNMPSLVVSACFAFLFSVLDVFWMLFTFFGMRRRLIFHRGDFIPTDNSAIGGWLGNSRSGGNAALLLSLVTHFVASIFTTSDYFQYGCSVSIPAVGGVLLVTMYLFWAGCGRIYMPPSPVSGGSLSSGQSVVSGHHLQSMSRDR